MGPRRQVRTSLLLLALSFAILLAACTRQLPVGDDRSIAFPQFFSDSAVMVGAGEKPYELDGAVLQAILIAANDFLPPNDEERPCWMRQEAWRYRVIRQGDIIFVRIVEDPDRCGTQYISVDTGAKYAISNDGRILRRIIGAEPEASTGHTPSDGGTPKSPDEPLEQYDGGVGLMTPEFPPTSHTPGDGGRWIEDAGSAGR